jgi:hypothetical protein
MQKCILRKIISFTLIAALVVLVGCQALGSLDLNKSFIDALLAKSQMSRQTITVDFKLDEHNKSMSESELTLLKVLSHLKLTFEEVKQESLQKASVKGKIELLNRSIPFQAYISPTILSVKIEGAKKPLVLDLAGKMGDTQSLLPLGIEKDLIEQFTTKLTTDENLHKAIFSYFVNGMPNPEGISLDNVTEAVYGETMSLNHVQAKVDGSQIIPLVKKNIVNLLQDDKGLRELVTQFYDVIQPVMMSFFDQMDKDKASSTTGAVPSDDPSSGTSSFLDSLGTGSMLGDYSSIVKGLESVLKDRTMAIEFLHTEAKQLLVIMMVGLQSVTEAKDPMIDQIFTNKSYVKADLYLDNSGKLRKTKAEVKIVPPAKDNGGVEEITLTMASEHWNINQPVKADEINTTDSYAMDSITKPAEILSILDKDSALYHLLKDDLQITKKSIVLNMYDSTYAPYSMLPYIDRGVTMVPVRFISEQLDANVTFDQETQEVTIMDEGRGTIVVLTLQNNIALLNSKTVKLDGAVLNRDGTTYVPLKFIANSLGAKVLWDKETKTITITRD